MASQTHTHTHKMVQSEMTSEEAQEWKEKSTQLFLAACPFDSKRRNILNEIRTLSFIQRKLMKYIELNSILSGKYLIDFGS